MTDAKPLVEKATLNRATRRRVKSTFGTAPKDGREPAVGITLAADLIKAAQEAPKALLGVDYTPGPDGVARRQLTRQPHWDSEKARLNAETDAKIKGDFKVFLALVWAHLGLGTPSDVQLSLADYLQNGAPLSVLMAFRGVGKSWVTAAFALWTLYCDPQQKVMVVSGNMKRATQFTTFCLDLIRQMPLLKHLMPRRDQRQSATSFDVGPAQPAQSTSFAAFGITGQLVGQRAGLVIADDVETNVNSITVMMREKLLDQVKEFNAILTPGGRIKFLGTPQSHDSIYNKLPAYGYAIRIWPMVFPSSVRSEKDKPSQLERYGDKLSPWVRNRTTSDSEGLSVWPERFGRDVVERQRIAWGTRGFDLQFMLDTSLSDANRFPLKLHNLIVMALPPDKGPEEVVWGNASDLVLQGLPTLGFEGDLFYGPARVGEHYAQWNTVVATIDPSDTGSDEAAINIGAELNGRVFVLKVAGWLRGTDPATLRAIAKLLVKFRVGYCRIESNFGGSMFGKLLRPYVVSEWEAWNKAHPKEYGGTTIEDERAMKVQKEKRIIADLQPATENHRIVVAQSVIEEDFAEVMARGEGDKASNLAYSLFHQFCYLTDDRDALPHDDRLDALADLIGHYRDLLDINPEALAAQHEEDRIQAELEALLGEEDEIGGTKSGPEPRSPRHTTGRRSTGW